MHDTLVAIAKSWGLFYMIGISLIVLVWVYRPSNRKRFDHAANSIIDAEDRPADVIPDRPTGTESDSPEARP